MVTTPTLFFIHFKRAVFDFWIKFFFQKQKHIVHWSNWILRSLRNINLNRKKQIQRTFEDYIYFYETKNIAFIKIKWFLCLLG